MDDLEEVEQRVVVEITVVEKTVHLERKDAPPSEDSDADGGQHWGTQEEN